MNTMDELLDRLHGGESIEDIAADLTAALNQANERYKRDLELQEIANRRAQMEQDIADMLNNYSKTYYNNFDVGDTPPFSAASIRDLFESAKEFMGFAQMLSDALKEDVNCAKSTRVEKSDVDAIADFLKMFDK